MSQKIVDRPVNINLFKIKLPMSALISITHRLSGIYVFFITLPLSIILFQKALTESSYDSMSLLIQTSVIFSTFVYFSFLIFLYHILTGFRHLLMDVHIGENLKASNMSAVFVISFWLVVSIFVLFVFFSFFFCHYFMNARLQCSFYSCVFLFFLLLLFCYFNPNIFS